MTYKEIVTHSELQTRRSCAMKHYLRYICGWRPAISGQRLHEGAVIHRAMELHYRGANEGAIFSALYDDFRKKFPQESDFSENKADLTRLLDVYRRYRKHWAGNDLIPVIDPASGQPMVEFEFLIPVYAPSGRPSTKYLLAGKIDLACYIPGVPEALGIWICDHKTTANTVTDADFERLALDQQMRTYAYAIHIYTGLPVAGVIYNKISATAPTTPAINKDGTVSIRKANYDPAEFIDTLKKQNAYLYGLTPEYRKATKLAAGIAWEKYEEILDHCRSLKWFDRREYSYAPCQMEATQMEIHQTVASFRAKWPTRNDLACDHYAGCSYRPICSGLSPEDDFMQTPAKHQELDLDVSKLHPPVGKPFVLDLDELNAGLVVTEAMLEKHTVTII